MKLVEVSAVKEFADAFLADPILKMVVNRVLDAAPEVDAIPVDAEDRESAEMCIQVVEKFLNTNRDCKIQYTLKLDGTVQMKFVDLVERRTNAD